MAHSPHMSYWYELQSSSRCTRFTTSLSRHGVRACIVSNGTHVICVCNIRVVRIRRPRLSCIMCNRVWHMAIINAAKRPRARIVMRVRDITKSPVCTCNVRLVHTRSYSRWRDCWHSRASALHVPHMQYSRPLLNNHEVRYHSL